MLEACFTVVVLAAVVDDVYVSIVECIVKCAVFSYIVQVTLNLFHIVIFNNYSPKAR